MNLAKALWVAGAALLVISAGLGYSAWSWAKHAVRARAVIVKSGLDRTERPGFFSFQGGPLLSYQPWVIYRYRDGAGNRHERKVFFERLADLDAGSIDIEYRADDPEQSRFLGEATPGSYAETTLALGIGLLALAGFTWFRNRCRPPPGQHQGKGLESPSGPDDHGAPRTDGTAGRQRGPVEVVCQECGQRSTFPASQYGRVQDCPHCGAYLDVEDPEAPLPWAKEAEGAADEEDDESGSR